MGTEADTGTTEASESPTGNKRTGNSPTGNKPTGNKPTGGRPTSKSAGARQRGEPREARVGVWTSRLLILGLLLFLGWVTAVSWAAVTTAAPVINEIIAGVEAEGGTLATTSEWWGNRAAYHEACDRLCDTSAGSTVMYLHLIGFLMPPVWLACLLTAIVALALSRPERWATWTATMVLFVAFHLPRLLYENTWLALLAVME